MLAGIVAAATLTACGQHEGVHRTPALPIPRATVPSEGATLEAQADALRDEAVAILARQSALPAQADLDLVDALLEQAVALDLEHLEARS